MGMRFAAAIGILLAVPCFCLAQTQQQAQTAQPSPPQESPASLRVAGDIPGRGEPRPYDGIAAFAGQPFVPQDGQERPGVPQGGRPATFGITRHGKIIFEADVREPDSARVVLNETVEISGIKSKSEWTPFVSAFVDATSRAWLGMIPPDAAAKKGKVVIAFALRHDGSLEGGLSVTRSSGDSAIDDAARLAIAKSAPFHELPSSFLGAAAQFRVTFAYNHPHPLAPATGNGSAP